MSPNMEARWRIEGTADGPRAADGLAITPDVGGSKIKDISGPLMYLSESLVCALVCTFFRFGVGMRHSI